MDVFEEAEMELGLEPGELAGTFPADFVEKVLCESCTCVWDYCEVAKRVALKKACNNCYPIEEGLDG